MGNRGPNMTLTNRVNGWDERGEDEGLDGVQNPAVEVSHPADAGQAVEAVADDEYVEKGSGDGKQNHGPEVVQEVSVVQCVGWVLWAKICFRA